MAEKHIKTINNLILSFVSTKASATLKKCPK